MMSEAREGSFCPGDDCAGRTVADHIHHRSSHVHQYIDAEEKENRFGGKAYGTGSGQKEHQHSTQNCRVALKSSNFRTRGISGI